MAKLNKPKLSGFEIGDLAQSGTHIATCLDIQDQFGVERPKFDNPNEKETRDVTRFLFGFRGQDGRSYRVQSFEFRISGSPKSNLFQFLTSWLGSPPNYDWDYCELKGQGAMITVAHKQSRDGTKTYAYLIGISPVIDQFKAQVLPLEAFQVGVAAPSHPPQAPVPGTQVSQPAPQQPQTQSGGYQQPPMPPQGQPHASGFSPQPSAQPPVQQAPQAPPPYPSAPPANSAVNPPQQAWNPATDSQMDCQF